MSATGSSRAGSPSRQTSAVGPQAIEVDVVIIGAGMSGVGAAYRLQQECPKLSYAVLEARDAIGGTWDLFRYPGVRSDSDIASFSYPFRPWAGTESLADGASIRAYIQATAAENGITERIQLGTRVTAASWSSQSARWTVEAVQSGPGGAQARRTTWTCSFLYSCAGYYDYSHGHEPHFPGREAFAGQVVHPQSWPGDLDCSGKRVVVIGSGATAVTLVPALAAQGAHVTMLQRSPSWLTSLPVHDSLADGLRRVLPGRLAQRAIRLRNIALSQALYQFCRARPEAAGRVLTKPIAAKLGPQMVAEHFTPRYQPWDQRLCVMLGGDLVRAIADGSVAIVTDEVESFVGAGVRLVSGRVLEADVIVTATGLQLLSMGGTQLTVDGSVVDLSALLAYRGVMLSGVPNFAFAMGYVNASWTLRADLSSRYVCRLLDYIARRGYAYGVPVAPPGSQRLPLIGLTSGYIQRAIDSVPKQGAAAPWRVRQNYLLDLLDMRRARLEQDMRFVPRGEIAPSGAVPEAVPSGVSPARAAR